MSRTRIQRTIAVFEASRRPLFSALKDISPTIFNWKPAPDVRGIGQICRHMYRVDIWFLGQLGIKAVITTDGPDAVDVIASRMRTIQEQVIGEVEKCGSDEDLLVERTSLDGGSTARLGPVVIHMAHHYLYHLAQIVYVRRMHDRDWNAPLAEWEEATHLIGDYVLEG